MNTQPSYYDILGVSPDASPSEITAAYKKAMQANHPDRAGDGDTYANARTALVNQAYAVLKDEASRRAYDRGLGRGPASSRPEPRPASRTPEQRTPTQPDPGRATSQDRRSQTGRRPTESTRTWTYSDPLEFNRGRSIVGWAGLQWQRLWRWMVPRGGLRKLQFTLVALAAAAFSLAGLMDLGVPPEAGAVFLTAVVGLAGAGYGGWQAFHSRPAHRRDIVSGVVMTLNGAPVAIVTVAALVVAGVLTVFLGAFLLFWSWFVGAFRD